MSYILDYANYHRIHSQCRAAFAAAFLLPKRHRISRQLRLPLTQYYDAQQLKPLARKHTPPWGSNQLQLDKMLTLSCNTPGMISLLSSTFIEPDLPCNVCGAWIQGAFAVLDTYISQKPHILTQVLVRRYPSLGFLSFGGILMGVQRYIMHLARPVAFQLYLNSAAWTNSFVSFIQKPVLDIASNAATLQRSD